MGEMIPLDISTAPSWLRDRYRRLALVSHRRHLASLDPSDQDTLVVVTDWLLWQRCLRQGRHTLHFEHLLADLPAERLPLERTLLRAVEWIWDGDQDMTLYKGVSLGQVFTYQCGIARQALERLWHGLARLCGRYRPEALVFFDVRGDIDMVDDPEKRVLIEGLARHCGLALDDRFDPVAPGDDDFPNPVVFRTPPPPKVRTALRQAYSRLVALAFDLRWRWQGRPPKVLTILDVHQVRGVMAGMDQAALTLMIEAGPAPKDPAFLGEAWRKGLVLGHTPAGSLTEGDRKRLAAMEQRLEQVWLAKPAADPVEEALRGFVRTRLIAQGGFRSTAHAVNRYAKLLDRHPLRRVVVGDSDFAQGRVVAELAAARGIPVDESLNGINLTDWQTPSRCGDGRRPPAVSRILAAGEFCRSWLRAIGSPAEMVVIGNPSLDALRPLAPHGGPRRRALLLPPYTVEADPAALTGTVGPALVRLAEQLVRRGYDVKVKVHPGHANPAYYAALMTEFGFDVEVAGQGSVRAWAEWADVVVGPPTSGAMAECLAMGRPYFPFVPLPSAVNGAHVPFLRLFRTAEEVAEALDQGWLPDCAAILAQMCAADGVPASAKLVRALSAAR